MKKTIELSVIVEAIEEAVNEWQQYYNTATGEIKSLPDWSNAYADRSEFEEDAEEIEESDDYIRLPTQRERNDYSIMEAFAEEKDSDELLRALRGRRPFRSFKDRAIQIGLIQDYYAYHSGACVKLARVWCEENEVPYIEDEKVRKALAAAQKAVPLPKPEQPITVLLHYHGVGENARSFAEEMEVSGIADAIRAEDGNLRYQYFQPLNDPETVLLIDSWRDQAALDAHHASPMMAQLAALREKYNLHMTVERYIGAGESLADERFIRR